MRRSADGTRGLTTAKMKGIFVFKGGWEETLGTIGNAQSNFLAGVHTKHLAFFGGPIFPNHLSGRFRARVAGVRSGGHNVRIGSEYDR